MDKSVLVFLPKQLDIKKTGYIRGFHKQFSDCEAFYVTSHKLFNNYCSDSVGFIGRKKNLLSLNRFFLHFNNTNTIYLNNKVINSDFMVQIIYDYNDFEQSHMLDMEGSYGLPFQELSSILRKENKIEQIRKKSGWMLILLINIYLMDIILWVILNYFMLR